jgi:hypothetical protein
MITKHPPKSKRGPRTFIRSREVIWKNPWSWNEYEFKHMLFNTERGQGTATPAALDDLYPSGTLGQKLELYRQENLEKVLKYVAKARVEDSGKQKGGMMPW